jgi:hypothetical protein
VAIFVSRPSRCHTQSLGSTVALLRTKPSRRWHSLAMPLGSRGSLAAAPPYLAQPGVSAGREGSGRLWQHPRWQPRWHAHRRSASARSQSGARPDKSPSKRGLSVPYHRRSRPLANGRSTPIEWSPVLEPPSPSPSGGGGSPCRGQSELHSDGFDYLMPGSVPSRPGCPSRAAGVKPLASA